MSGNILSFPLLQNVLCPSARRLLFPMEEQNAVSLTDLDRPSLIITIIAARNIPSRSFNNVISVQKPSLRSPSRHMDDFIGHTVGFDPTCPTQENECVHPFFQVQFRGKKYFSKVVSRKSPYFKQTLAIPLLSDDDDTIFSPKNLIETDDSIDMKLFDAFELGSVDACDHHFIGDWTIPLKFLYCNSKVGGTFRLNIPEILIGYEKTHGFMGDDAPSALKVPNRVPEDSAVDYSDSYENIDWSTYLDIAVNIHPNISQCILDNEGLLEDTTYNEDASLLEALKIWIDDYKPGSSRWIRSTATDLEGNRWIITRYIKRLPPPHSIRKSMRHCCHFVSLLALRSSIAVLRSYSGRVSSCQQFIDLQSGDELEHAILLANFFLYLSKKRRDRCECNVFMVFGRGHSDEQVVSIYTEQNAVSLTHLTSVSAHLLEYKTVQKALVGTEMKDKRFLLWDALKGNVYSVKNDTWYPIVEISNLVTSSVSENWCLIKKKNCPSVV
jgi:coiled-coil and C2 domain-containing protein 2A